MASREDRLKALGQRFAHSETAMPPMPDREQDPTPQPLQEQRILEQGSRSRRRHSWYLDTALVEKVDAAYKAMAHEMYPTDLTKSDFLEACLNFALAHLGEVKAALS